MNQSVRWGLLSTANINRRLIPALQMSERGELTAVASRNSQSAETYAEAWDIPHAFGTYEALLQSDVIDAIYISLPNHLHAEWAITAMRHGKHVLCEKPFATTLAEVDEMIAVSKEMGMVLTEAFMYRHHPQTKKVGEMVQNGRLGDILLVRGVFNFAMGNRHGNVRLVPQYGGGALWDVGVYPLSMAQYVMGGLPDSVYGHQHLGESEVDELFSGQLHYTGGRMAQISASFNTPWYTIVDIVGTKGRLLLNRPFTNIEPPEAKLLFYPSDGDVVEVEVNNEYLYLGEVEDMHRAIFDGSPNYLSLIETRHHVQTVLALYESARNGRIVYLK
jgi:D-xylose 1-dehydrogenase (NADP+, D-xylono-1,5-lactone-forming)